MTTEIKLTDREIAIAKGEDPDAPVVEAVETPQEAEQTVEKDEAVEQDAHGKDADDKGTDAQPQPETDSASDWVNDEVVELAQSYGLTAEELRQFASPEEFRRAGVLFDKQLTKPAKTEEAAPANPETKADAEVDFDIAKLKEEGYDDTTLKIAETAKTAKERTAALEKQLSEIATKQKEYVARYQEQLTQQRMDMFHREVDDLNQDLFGKRRDADGKFIKLDPKLDKNRERLMEAADVIYEGMVNHAKRLGRPLENVNPKVILKRAMNMAFAEEMAAAEKAKLTAQMEAQSKKRRSVGVANRTAPREAAPKVPTSLSEQARLIANDPKLVAFWNKATQENGSE